MNTSRTWMYSTVMFTESLTRTGLIKFIFCNQYCSLVVYDINILFLLNHFIFLETAQAPTLNLSPFICPFLNTVSNTLIKYGVIVAQVDGHAYLNFVLKRRSRLVLSFKPRSRPADDSNEEEEQDHREY